MLGGGRHISSHNTFPLTRGTKEKERARQNKKGKEGGGKGENKGGRKKLAFYVVVLATLKYSAVTQGYILDSGSKVFQSL